MRGADRGDGPAGRVAAGAGAGGARLPGRLHRGGPRDGRPRAGPADHRGDGRRADRRAARDAIRWRPRRGSCPRAAAGSTSRPAAATRAEAHAAADAVATAMTPYALSSLVVSEPARMKALWRIREDGAGILTRSPDGGEAWPGWEDAAVPPERFGAYLREFDARARPARPPRRLLRALRRRLPARPDRLRPRVRGPGSRTSGRSWRTRPTSPSRTAGRCRASTATAPPAPSCCPGCTRRRSSGRSRSSRASGTPTAGSTRTASCDPRGWTTTCGCSSGCPPCATPRRSRSPHDRGSFARATRRCLGVGKCVTAHGGVMCPSFRATGEEMHSTRGTRPAAVRDGERPGGPGRLAVRRGGRGAGPVPVVQGVQARLPGRRRHGRLQDRVPRAALPRAACARWRTTRWARCPAGCTWWAGSRRGWWTR